MDLNTKMHVTSMTLIMGLNSIHISSKILFKLSHKVSFMITFTKARLGLQRLCKTDV